MFSLLTLYYLAQSDITVGGQVGEIIIPATPTPTPVATATQSSAPTSESNATTAPTTTSSPSPRPTTKPTASPSTPPIYVFPTPPSYIKNYKPKPLSIYGYGPINSEVTLRGFGVSERTTSDSTGLFRFTEIYSFTYAYPELCIQLKDLEKRVTQPTCIPPLPNNSPVPLEVGPVLLSPTVSLSGNKIIEGGQSYLSGKTTPNTDVFIYIAKDNKKTFALVPEALAYNLPAINTVSNDKGEFDINMPTSDTAEFKVFASTKFADNLSAKSNTLHFAVISSTKSFFQNIIDYFLQNKITIFLGLEVLIFIILFLNALKTTKRRHKTHTEKEYLDFLTQK